jgi:hypothetical protein
MGVTCPKAEWRESKSFERRRERESCKRRIERERALREKQRGERDVQQIQRQTAERERKFFLTLDISVRSD